MLNSESLTELGIELNAIKDSITPSGLKLIRDFKAVCLLKAENHRPEAADKIRQLPSIVFDAAITLHRLSLLAPQQQLEASVVAVGVQFGYLQLRRIELAYKLTDAFLIERRRWLFRRMIAMCRGSPRSVHEVRSFAFFKRPDIKRLYCHEAERLADESMRLNKAEIVEFWRDLATVEDAIYDPVECVLIPPPKQEKKH